MNGNPVNSVDPTGLKCVATGNSVTCTPQGGKPVTFPRPGGWPDFIDENHPNYHYYDVRINAPCRKPNSVEEGITNSPTPGLPLPASPNGTPNNATPWGLESFISSPVISYVMSNGAVVNVTQPGHPLHPGYVERIVSPNSSGSTIDNIGEGAGWQQSRLGPFRWYINGVWESQSQGIVDGIAPSCGCQ